MSVDDKRLQGRMPQAKAPVDEAKVDAFVIDFIDKNKSVLQSHADPVRWIMWHAMAEFNGGLNPMRLRPLVAVRYYGARATSEYLKVAKIQLQSLEEFFLADDLESLNQLRGAILAIDGLIGSG